MTKNPNSKIPTIEEINYLGIIAGIFDSLKIEETIDKRFPKIPEKKPTHGQIVKALVINAFDNPEGEPTLRPEYYRRFSTERLNIEEVTKESDGIRKKEFTFLNEKNATVIDALGPECIRYYLGEEVYANRNKD